MYLQLNAEFQRRARRDKKAFFNIQCIKIEKNNREQRTRGLFRKTGNIKRTCCSIKDRNGMDLTKKIFTTRIIMMM